MTASVSGPSTILVPVDFSARSELGLRYAANLAASCGASLVLMSNLNLPERAALEVFAEAEHLDIVAAGEGQLRRLAQEVAPEVETSVVVTEMDSPALGILASVGPAGADLIVIASHGRGGMTRWMLGSVAEKVTRSADVPVVVIPARDDAGPESLS